MLFWNGRCAALLLVAAAFSQGCTEKATAIVVAVRTDYGSEEYRRLRAVVRDAAGAVSSEASFTQPLPLSFGVAPKSDPAAVVVVELELYGPGDQMLVRRRAQTGFVEGETLLLPMFLPRSCESVACVRADLTCTERGCVSDVVDPATLSPVESGNEFTQFPQPRAVDAGAPDGGPSLDAGLPDASPEDTGLADLGTGDAGSDAGVSDTGAPDVSGPDTGAPDTGAPDGGPDAGPDVGGPDLGVPDVGVPDVGVPDSGVLICDGARAIRPSPTTAVVLDNSPNQNSWRPSVAMNSGGDGVVAWEEFDGVRMNAVARRYDPNADVWQPVEALESAVGSAGLPQAAVDDDGTMTVLFRRTATDSDFTGSIYAARYVPQNAIWATQGIETGTESAFAPKLAAKNGRAFAAWSFGATSSSIWANRFETNWSTEQSVRPTAGVSSHEVAINSSGAGMMIWEEGVSPNVVILTSRYNDAMQTWDGVQPVQPSPGSVDAPEIAMFESGDAVAVWRQSGSTLRANVHAGGVWGTSAVRVDVGTGTLGFPTALGVDACGNAITVFTKVNAGVFSVQASRYRPGPGWSAPVSLDQGTLSASNPKVAVSPNGHAVAAWTAGDAVWVSTFVNGTWGQEQQVASGGVGSIDVAIAGNGDAFVVWEQPTTGSADDVHVLSLR